MSHPPAYPLDKIAAQFQIDGRFLDAAPYGTGHINDTYASRFETSRGVSRFIHQRINHLVFRQPPQLMENIVRVTSYARQCILAAGGDPERETLNLIPTLDGAWYYVDPQGNTWRTYIFIEGARTYDQVEDLRHVYNAARAFGNFQKLLGSLPGGRLHETIPNFHNTRKRLEAFLAAKEQDVRQRAALAKIEIGFVMQRQAEASILVDGMAQGTIPERVTHNDTKLNNVMIDDQTGEGICVIDLDTMMPGSALYDFGDSVRIGASTAVEDERDLSKVTVDLAMFERLAHGYLDAARDFLTPVEIDLMAFSARLMTFECGMRFLTDYLSGDVYFKIHRPDHNLDRCRTQFKMVAEMEKREAEMKAIVRQYA